MSEAQHEGRPPYAGQPYGLAWLAHEVWDHLWPWSRGGFRRQRALQAVSLGVAVLVTAAWVLAAAGHLRTGGILGWWVGWSAFEVVVRMQSKPWVKEGPWWGRNYRRANVMDMLSYVLFKNLLIGAALFLALKWLGWLNP